MTEITVKEGPPSHLTTKKEEPEPAPDPTPSPVQTARLVCWLIYHIRPQSYFLICNIIVWVEERRYWYLRNILLFRFCWISLSNLSSSSYLFLEYPFRPLAFDATLLFLICLTWIFYAIFLVKYDPPSLFQVTVDNHLEFIRYHFYYFSTI